MFKSCTKLEKITAAGDWKLPALTDSSSMFTGCFALKGGNGTAYNASYVTSEYALIDKEGQVGYFTAPPYLIGDVNRDGSITADDAIIAARLAAGYGDYSTRYDAEIADMNQDGKVTADDAIIIARYAAGYSNYREIYTNYI
jgi:hypothetical protein